MKSFKKSFLKHIFNDVSDFLSSAADSFPNQQWYEMTLDLIESRMYNPPTSKLLKPNQTFNKVTLCKQKHAHNKHYHNNK